MKHHGMDAEPAWRAMVRVSQDNNITVRDLATEIIHARQLPPTLSSAQTEEGRSCQPLV